MRSSSILRYGLGILKRSGIPEYTSKYSRKDFTTHQLLLICVLKERNKCAWRKVVDDLEDSSLVFEVLELKKVPHFTTPNKFLLRIPAWWFNYILSIICKYTISQYYVAVDGTCFKLSNASSHYEIRICRERKRRDWLKPIISWDTKTQLILRVKIVGGNRNESPHMRAVLKTLTHAMAVYADKGYDSEKNQELARRLGTKSFIDVRGKPRRGHYRKIVYRLKTNSPAIRNSNYYERNLAVSRSVSLTSQSIFIFSGTE